MIKALSLALVSIAFANNFAETSYLNTSDVTPSYTMEKSDVEGSGSRGGQTRRDGFGSVNPGRDEVASVLSGDSAKPYVMGGGGCSYSLEQSNNDEIEFGSECGFWGSLEVGYSWNLDESSNVSLGGEILHIGKNLHGQNGRSKQSADGNRLNLSTISIIGRYEKLIYGPISIYAMAGFGSGWARGLNDTDFIPVLQGEGGLAFDLAEGLDIGGGYRIMKTFGLDLDGNSGDPTFYGPWGWVRWTFD